MSELAEPLLATLTLPEDAGVQAQEVLECCSDAERAAIDADDGSTAATGRVVAAKVLGCLLFTVLDKPTDITEGIVTAICRQILHDATGEQTRHEIVFELGASYRDRLFGGCTIFSP